MITSKVSLKPLVAIIGISSPIVAPGKLIFKAKVPPYVVVSATAIWSKSPPAKLLPLISRFSVPLLKFSLPSKFNLPIGNPVIKVPPAVL